MPVKIKDIPELKENLAVLQNLLILTGDAGQDLLKQFNTSVNNLATEPSLFELKSNLTQVFKKLARVTHPDKFTPTELKEKLEKIENSTPQDTNIKSKLLSNNENPGDLFKFMSLTIENTKKELSRPSQLLHPKPTGDSVQQTNPSDTRTPGVHPNQQQPAARGAGGESKPRSTIPLHEAINFVSKRHTFNKDFKKDLEYAKKLSKPNSLLSCYNRTQKKITQCHQQFQTHDDYAVDLALNKVVLKDLIKILEAQGKRFKKIIVWNTAGLSGSKIKKCKKALDQVKVAHYFCHANEITAAHVSLAQQALSFDSRSKSSFMKFKQKHPFLITNLTEFDLICQLSQLCDEQLSSNPTMKQEYLSKHTNLVKLKHDLQSAMSSLATLPPPKGHRLQSADSILHLIKQAKTTFNQHRKTSGFFRTHFSSTSSGKALQAFMKENKHELELLKQTYDLIPTHQPSEKKGYS